MPDKPSNVLDVIFSILISKEVSIAIGAGFVGAVVSPWTKWHFKKQELKRAGRKAKIEEWRTFLSSIESADDLFSSLLYEELISEVPKEEKRELFENGDIEHVCELGQTAIVTQLHDRVVLRLNKVVAKKEKDWDLI